MKYTKSHEWVLVKDGIAAVGITEYGRRELGTPVFVEMPIVGTRVTRGEEAVVVESTKAASDLYSPVSGEVVEVNLAVVNNPGSAGCRPESEGWLFKVRLDNPEELQDLLDEKEYEAMFRS